MPTLILSILAVLALIAGTLYFGAHHMGNRQMPEPLQVLLLPCALLFFAGVWVHQLLTGARKTRNAADTREPDELDGTNKLSDLDDEDDIPN